MTLARRVAAIDASLSPTQLVLRWLDEAHAYGDLDLYVRALLDADPPEQPIDRLCEEAANGVRARLRGKRPEVVNPAVRTALRETLLRYLLVIRLNRAAHDLLEREALIEKLLSAQLALATCEARERRLEDPSHLEHLGKVRDACTSRLGELRAVQDARAAVEARYLDGHTALFPDVARGWEQQLERSASLEVLACRLSEIDDVPPPERADPDAVVDRVTELVADLVEPAKADTLERLGEDEWSTSLAIRWLRTRLVTEGNPPEDAADAGAQGATP